LQQSGIKAEMKRIIHSNLSKEEQEVFRFSINDKPSLAKLEWENDHEFRLDGKMYDVIERKMENGNLIIRCISDEKETALLNKLNENWKENDRSNKIAIELYQLLQTLFHENNSKNIILQTSTTYCSLFRLDKLPLQIKKIPTPPPQFSNSHFIPIAIGAI
jgi:hypothetical protein